MLPESSILIRSPDSRNDKKACSRIKARWVRSHFREVVHCALSGASCGQQMISVDLQSAPIITGEATLPLRWLCQLPLCGLAARKSFRKPIPFSKLKLHNSASDKSEFEREHWDEKDKFYNRYNHCSSQRNKYPSNNQPQSIRQYEQKLFRANNYNF